MWCRSFWSRWLKGNARLWHLQNTTQSFLSIWLHEALSFVHCIVILLKHKSVFPINHSLNLFGCLAEAIRKPEVLGFKSTKPTSFHYNVKYRVKEQIFVSAICNHLIWINQRPLQSSQSRIRIRICNGKP